MFVVTWLTLTHRHIHTCIPKQQTYVPKWTVRVRMCVGQVTTHEHTTYTLENVRSCDRAPLKNAQKTDTWPRWMHATRSSEQRSSTHTHKLALCIQIQNKGKLYTMRRWKKCCEDLGSRPQMQTKLSSDGCSYFSLKIRFECSLMILKKFCFVIYSREKSCNSPPASPFICSSLNQSRWCNNNKKTITKIPSKWSTIITRAIQLMLLTTIHVHSNENERFSFQ